MPTRWGVLVWVVVGVSLAGYYVLMVESERVGDWRVYQGRGRCWRERSSGARGLDVSYTVKHPREPLFSYVALAAGSDRVGDTARLQLSYQSEWPTTLLVVVRERDGSAYGTHIDMSHSETWTPVSLAPGTFNPHGTSGNQDENGVLDFDQLTPCVEFYDGSGVTTPSTTFSNRLRLTPPVLGQTSAP